MTRLTALMALFAASPAFADGGLHLHPHGIDAGWAILAASAGLGALAAVVAKVRK